MERDVSPLKVLIEKIVKDELENIAREIKSLVKQTVKVSFISEIRESVRNAISETIEGLLPGTQEPEFMPSSGENHWDKNVPQILNLFQDRRGFLTPQKGFSEETTGDGDNSGRYLYCIVESNDRLSLGRIGIDGNEVYTIPYKDLAAVVHNCPSEPYTSEDSEIVTGWIVAHQEVLERAAQRFGTVIPLGFSTIIKGVNGQRPEQNMEEWLKGDYENLKGKIARLRGKEEYGVQIFWDPKIIGQKIAQTNPEIKKLDEDIKSKPRGMAYMYKQKLEDALKTELEKAADRYFKEFYEQIKTWVDDLRVEKTKKAEEGKQMLMNLSCLMDKERYKKLGEELERIDHMDGFFVRFTGPWPPYSFV